MDAGNVERIISLIYEASFDEEIWPVVANRMSDIFGDSGVTIALQALSHKELLDFATARFDESKRNQHIEEYDTPEKNVALAALMSAPVGLPFDMASFVDAKTYEREPGIRAILHPQHINKALLVTTERNDSVLGFVCVFRRTHQADFEPEHTKALKVLSTHIARACKFQRQILSLDCQNRIADIRIGAELQICGALVLAPNGALKDADASALAILKANKGLAVRRGKLVSKSATNGQDTESLHSFLSDFSYKNKFFVVWGQDGSLITLEVLPMSFSSSLPGHGNCRLVIARHFRPKKQPNIQSFTLAYSLTKAEVRVVEALISATNASEAASSLGISRETMKTHLRHIYAKTETESLPQLLLLVGRFG